MKVKELKRTVNVCWSPVDHYPLTIAAGSAAQQVDSSFSSSSYLELYSLNLEDPGLDLELKSSLQTEHKFQKIVWSGAGILVGGCDGGLLQFYSADKLLNNPTDALLGSSTKHNGNVSALDINPYQKNLLASGASESEIFIWDLNNTSQPMAPGNKNQPYDHVQGLAWNQQVQHILGSTFATRCVVWDLRKNEPIMKLSDSQSRTRWRSLAWHPSVATQVCIASEDDQVPVVQLWDLRLAASPLVTLEGHQKGVMSVSWSKQDPDLLLSAGKDGRVLCWNPNNTKPGGELLTEISHQQQWVFDVSWCPRDPGLMVTASFDQHVAVHSLLGGSRPEITTHNQSSIMESFGGLDSFSALPAVARAPAAPAPAPRLPRPPRWLQRPAAAKFSFGGKLVTFEKCPQEAGPQKLVYISQVISEPEIVERATELDAVLDTTLSHDPAAIERLAEYCRQKGDAATDQNERYTWFFLRANFMPTFRTEVLNLLGFKHDEMSSKFKSSSVPAGDVTQPDVAGLSRGESTETEAELSTDTSTDLSDAHTLIERKLANLDLTPTVSNVVIPNGEDSTSLICRALVCGNLEEAVELCLDAKRVADALIIASLGSPELLYKVQKYHLNSSAGEPVSLICGSLLMAQWDSLVSSSAAGSWKETLAAILTHCDGEAASHYCEMLGDKLSKESDPSLLSAATICYLCAMSPEELVSRWGGAGAGAGPGAGARRGGVAALVARTELALLARRAALARGRPVPAGGKLESVLNEYASRLAAQGCLQSALNALEGIQHTELRERLLHALGLLQQQRRASHQAQAQAQARAPSAGPAAHAQRRAHLAHPDHGFPAAQTYDQSWQRSSVAAPDMRGYPAAQAQAPAQALPPQPAPPQPAQPPRPGSVGPQAGGFTSRSKYKVDPSVASAPLYNQYSFNSPVTSQPYGYNSPLPDQYPNPTQQPHLLAPQGPQMGVNNSMSQPGLNPVVNGSYYTPAQAPPEPAVPAVAAKPVPPGWNDPPMMSSKPKPKQEVTAQAPITHPLFGVEPPQHVPLAPQLGPAPPQLAQHYPQQYSDYQPMPAPMTPAYPQKTESPAPVEPPAPVQKPPLPDQHALLQNVLDSIRTECSNRAVNPQMKRKLEDVQRRLETLYDLLREYKLSETAISSLHACADSAQRGDLDSALGLANGLATGSDFAAVASFQPGLKVLFQLAAQLQIFVR